MKKNIFYCLIQWFIQKSLIFLIIWNKYMKKDIYSHTDYFNKFIRKLIFQILFCFFFFLLIVWFKKYKLLLIKLFSKKHGLLDEYRSPVLKYRCQSCNLNIFTCHKLKLSQMFKILNYLILFNFKKQQMKNKLHIPFRNRILNLSQIIFFCYDA